MPDRRRHRGAHPQDAELFAPERVPALRMATADLGWLLGRGYAQDAALTLVCDHHQLRRRQRVAVARSACAPAAAAARRAGTVGPAGADLVIDGFNIVITVEAALGGGVLLRGADGRCRDLASVHGTYRSVEETTAALDHLQRALRPARQVHWILDRPVSNSGKLAGLLRDRGWTAELAARADNSLLDAAQQGALLASADGPLLDRVLAGGGALTDPVPALLEGLPSPWLVDLYPDRHPPR